jgi:hypothetical protein
MAHGRGRVNEIARAREMKEVKEVKEVKGRRWKR